MTLAIRTFQPEDAERFALLNRAWLEEHGLLEPLDEEQLADPAKHFLVDGGEIFVAVDGGVVVGTCGALPHGANDFELAKLAVAPEFRGQGIARRLVARCVEHIRERGADRVLLISSSRLKAALRLYESMGFTHCPAPDFSHYETADVWMELVFDRGLFPRTDPH